MPPMAALSGLLPVALAGTLLALLPQDPPPASGPTSYLPVDRTEPFPVLVAFLRQL